MVPWVAKNTADRTGAVLIVGGGIAGVQASLDLAEIGYKVFLAERSPYIGGAVGELCSKAGPIQPLKGLTVSVVGKGLVIGGRLAGALFLLLTILYLVFRGESKLWA